MILRTARLLLRPMARADAPALFAILGDAEAMRFWDRPPLPRLATVEAQMEDELAAMAAGRFFAWMAVLDGDAVGSLDLKPAGAGEAWTGFAFRRDVWGRGLAREAMEAVIGHALGTMNLGRLMARVQSGNGRAVHLLEALGYGRDGALADVVREGETRAVARYVLDRMSSGARRA
jgi:ribosomal-protein-alanine N-acetyltransferase